MTARRPDAIGAHPRRRLAWARRENERRRQAYETAARAWRRRAEHLDRLRIEAAGFHGCVLAGAPLPVPLDDGEVVYRILPTVDLVEAAARHLPGLPVPGGTLAGCLDPAEGPLPAGLRVIASGAAVVTDRRVAFTGPGVGREWPLRTLRGLGHHPGRPVTLLHGTDGGAPAGLRVPAPGAANARFYLTLAHADATGTRTAVVEDVEALWSAHRAARPRPPRPLGPWDAPAERALPQRLAAAGVAAMAVLLGVTSAGTWTATAGQTDPAARTATHPATAPPPAVSSVPPVATPVNPSSPPASRPPRPAPRPPAAGSGDRVPTTAPPAAGSPSTRVSGRTPVIVESSGPPAAGPATPAPSVSPTADPVPTGEPDPTAEPSPSAASAEPSVLDLVGLHLGLAVGSGATAQQDATLP
ncbi:MULTISPECIES: hypothetical protein [Micromonospora]|uniref:hypothetical protein n=1 Tax=Micromonospora TaxID=1873 RepID=UPI0003EEE01A|nr:MULTISPECIES: hypothetical protein [unclassified Micromonospora]EWM63834.1 basic proline-rich protein [Micromonospora sp. M42]MCK1806979.1 hypothetical protein [Micromonospora sp. R42106]MCM1015021.1 hypothetical protein [Micromonospora sp. XM-20-01]